MRPLILTPLRCLTGGVFLTGACLWWQTASIPERPDRPSYQANPAFPRARQLSENWKPPTAPPADGRIHTGTPASKRSAAPPATIGASPVHPPSPQKPTLPEIASEAPSFRPVPPKPNRSGGPPLPVILEFNPESRLPAILAAPTAARIDRNPAAATQTAVEAAILEEFIVAVTPPEESPGNDAPEQLALQDKIWDEAATDADKQLRVLLGSSAYQQRSLNAARLRLQLKAQPQPAEN